jgi:hypothetical protein
MGVNMFSETMSLADNTSAPIEAGIKRLKEKLKACTGDSPSNRAAKMVEPERETAGRIARAWNKPIIIAFLKSSLLSLGGKYFDTRRNIAVMRKNRGNSFISANIDSTCFLQRIPTIAAGTEPTIMYGRLSKKYFNCLLKKKRTEKRVAVFRKTSKARDGLRPKMC